MGIYRIVVMNVRPLLFDLCLSGISLHVSWDKGQKTVEGLTGLSQNGPF